MSRRLKKAREKTKELPDSLFSKGTKLNVEDLPCISDKEEKVKKTFNYRASAIEKAEKIAKDNKVAVGDLISDILESVL